MSDHPTNGGTTLRFPRFGRLPHLPVKGLGPLLLIAAAAFLAFSAFYTIDPEEQGVVLRFGRFVGTTDPGLHLKIPFVDQVVKVGVQRQQKEEFGFRTQAIGVRSEFERVLDESLMLTGDLNAASVEWVVQFRIVDPYRYLFRVRNVRETLRDLSEAVVREVVGDRTVNEVLTVGRQEIELLVTEKLQVLCDQYDTGIKIEQVVLQDVNPPDSVKDSFNEVNKAQQDRERLINEAQSEYNRVIPRARGEAEQTIETARGYALGRVNRARGEAARFDSIFAEYSRAPEVTRRRMHLETLQQVLPKLGRKLVLDGSLEGVLPLLDLGRAGAAAKTITPDGGSE